MGGRLKDPKIENKTYRHFVCNIIQDENCRTTWKGLRKVVIEGMACQLPPKKVANDLKINLAP